MGYAGFLLSATFTTLGASAFFHLRRFKMERSGIVAPPKPVEADEAPQPQHQPQRKVHILGLDEEGVPRGVFKDERFHIAVVGFPGTGKSRFLLSLVIQNILDGEGCLVMDPHGDLVELLLSHIPRKRWDDVVYIDPLTSIKYGRVVQINFLEYMDVKERDLVARMFMDSLEKMYGRFWGPRLDMILINAIYLLMDSGKAKLGDLYNVIADEERRGSLLGMVKDEKVKSFWLNEYKRMPREASSSALTKIYRLCQERIVVPMFDCERSSVDFRRLMDDRKIVVVNLSEGEITSDVANFIGSLLLARVYLAGMSREDTPENMRVPFYGYVDEAYRFETSSTKDILQSLRKYKVYMTLASQYLQQYRKDVALSIPSLCDTTICFSVGEDTAKALEEFYRPSLNYQHIMNLPRYYFAASAIIGGRRECMVLKCIDHGRGENNVEEVIKHSLERHGREVDMSQYTGTPALGSLPYPPVKPIQWLIITRLYGLYEERLGAGMHRDGTLPQIEAEALTKELEEECGFQALDTAEALRSLCQSGWILAREDERRWMGIWIPEASWSVQPVECHKCGNPTNRPYILRSRQALCRVCAETALVKKEKAPHEFIQPLLRDEDFASTLKPTHRSRTFTYYALRLQGKNVFFDDVPKGRRGGGDRHAYVIGALVDSRRKGGCYCIVDLGEEAPQRKGNGETIYETKKQPDILVYPLLKREDGGVNPKLWDTTHQYAIEVEIDPSKHPSRVANNWKKCRELNLPSIFATDKEDEARWLVKHLRDYGAEVVPDNLNPFNPKASSVRFVDPETRTEAQVTREDQPLSTEEITARKQPREETVETALTLEAPERETQILLCIQLGMHFRGVWAGDELRLKAWKQVGSKIATVDLGPYDDEAKQIVERLSLEAPIIEALSKPKAEKTVETPLSTETPTEPAHKITEAAEKAVIEKAVTVEEGEEPETERMRQIREYVDQGYSLRVKRVKGRLYLYADKWTEGKTDSKSLGPIDEEARRLITKLGLKVKGL